MRSTLICSLIALITISLGACKPAGQDLSENIVPSNPITAKVGLSPRERNLEALTLLQEGKAQEARVELQASLAELPAGKNALAQNLLSQIDDDPVATLGSKNFKHQIAKGESLSGIADQYLGDKFKFYALARYNNIDNPGQVKAGDVIKVPGNELAKAAPKPPAIEDDVTPPIPDKPATPEIAGDVTPPIPDKPTAIANVATPPAPDKPTTPEDGLAEMDLLADAGEMVNAGNYGGAIIHLEKGLTQFPDTKMIEDYLAGVYVKQGGKLSEQQKYEEARSAYQQASVLAPENKDIGVRLAEADRAAKAEDLYRDGQKYFKRDAVIDAYESYNAALKVWSGHDRAQIEKAKISPRVADYYYREGRTAFQRQDLKGALIMYNKTLEVDPNHEPAKLNRQQTIELLDRMKDHNTPSEQDGAGQNATPNWARDK